MLRVATAFGAVALLGLGMAAMLVGDEETEIGVIAGSDTTSSVQQPATTTTRAGVAAPAEDDDAATTSTSEPVTTTAPAHVSQPPRASSRGYPGAEPPDGVIITMTLARTELRQGDIVRGTLVVENHTDETIYSSGCRSDWGLFLDGEFVGGHVSTGCGADVQEVAPPGGTYREDFMLDTLRAGADEASREPLPAGFYDATAGIEGGTFHEDGGDEQPSFWYAPITVVEIVE